MEEEISIYFNPFDCHLLGVIGKHIYFREIVYNDDENNKDDYCVLKIPKPMFNKMLKEYLEEKESYCTRYNHFCGCGNIYIDGFKTKGTMNILIDFDDKEDTPIYKDIPVYLVLEYSIDMEHG